MELINDNEQDAIEEFSEQICDKIIYHVSMCNKCQRKLSFDPTDMAILKSYSITNEILEVIVYICLGIFIIFVLYILDKK